MASNDRQASRWPEHAERIFSAVEVTRALERQAERLRKRLPADRPLNVVVLMKGGMYPAVRLTARLDLPMRIDYIHATRYRDEKRGGEIQWVRDLETCTLEGTVLIIDDIFDEGYTLQAVRNRLLEKGASGVMTAVLANKQHDRGLPRDWVDDHALLVPDRYVFGCGMDLHGYWRQLDEIWAV